MSTPARPRRSRRGPLLLVVALVIALAAGLGAYWFGWARYTATPGVIGLSQQAAVAKLDHAGLHATLGDPAYSETVAKGHVVTTNPDPGAQVLHHGTVTVTISLGKERYAVPKVARLTVDQAQDALLKQHLAYGRSIPRYAESAPQGMVLGTNPPAGSREPKGFQVDLVVSRGPRPLHIRDWTGASADKAIQALRARGLQVDSGDHEYSTEVAAGHVISQTPVDAVLHRGDTVSLVVSKGPQLVAIPDNLRGMGQADAVQELEGLGFHVRLVKTDFYVGLHYVVGSSPDPGTLVPLGSTVYLKIV